MTTTIPTLGGRKRVKVYELRGENWFDRGTGFCAANLIHEESRIFVESEEDSDCVLLEYKFRKDDQFQKQQETLIVWNDPQGTDMAMSFQEVEGCAMVWRMLSEAQDHLEDSCDPPLPALPSPNLSNLAVVEDLIERSSSTPAGRDSLCKTVLSNNYIADLVPLVEAAEDLEDLEGLHRLCRIMKILILLNENSIIENVIKDDIMMGVVGALEYDPDFPNHKANHRQYLSKVSKFKQVIKIDNEEIEKRIHLTYRLQYLKDVVLARVLDDPTFNVLNSQIYFYHSEIVNYIQSHEPFMRTLSGIVQSSAAGYEQKKDVVFLIQQCCAIAKLASSRSMLYQSMIAGGLFKVLMFALQHQESIVRTAGTDILVAVVDNDPFMIRSHIFKDMQESARSLTDSLISLLLAENVLGVKAQIADAIKVLLDPSVPALTQDRASLAESGFPGRFKTHPQQMAQTESFIEHFYKYSARKLFQPIISLDNCQDLSLRDVSLYSHLIDMLCFFLRQHAQRSRYFILSEGLGGKVAKLLVCHEKHLKLAAVKYFRTLLSLQDELFNKQLAQSGTFKIILDAIHASMPRDNLFNSACLDLFEFVRRENITTIIDYLVIHYRERLVSITYVDTFQAVIQQHASNNHTSQDTPVTRADDNLLESSSFVSSEADSPNTRHVTIQNDASRWQLLSEPRLDEESYYSTTAGDDGQTSSYVSAIGTLKSLVDYDDDEGDVDEQDSNEAEAVEPNLVKLQSDGSNELPAAAPFDELSQPLSNIPATRLRSSLSEKRRREEEDESDGLERSSLGISKRRNSLPSRRPPHRPTDETRIPEALNAVALVGFKTAAAQDKSGPGTAGKKEAFMLESMPSVAATSPSHESSPEQMDDKSRQSKCE